MWHIQAANAHAIAHNTLLLYLGLYLVNWAQPWDNGSLTHNKYLPHSKFWSQICTDSFNLGLDQQQAQFWMSMAMCRGTIAGNYRRDVTCDFQSFLPSYGIFIKRKWSTGRLYIQFLNLKVIKVQSCQLPNIPSLGLVNQVFLVDIRKLCCAHAQ